MSIGWMFPEDPSLRRLGMKKKELLRWIEELEQWLKSRAEINDRGQLAPSDLQELRRRLELLAVRLPR